MERKKESQKSCLDQSKLPQILEMCILYNVCVSLQVYSLFQRPHKPSFSHISIQFNQKVTELRPNRHPLLLNHITVQQLAQCSLETLNFHESNLLLLNIIKQGVPSVLTPCFCSNLLT